MNIKVSAPSGAGSIVCPAQLARFRGNHAAGTPFDTLGIFHRMRGQDNLVGGANRLKSRSLHERTYALFH
jgi:hypothetical protein